MVQSSGPPGSVRLDGERFVQDPGVAQFFPHLLGASEAHRVVSNPDPDLKTMIAGRMVTTAFSTEMHQRQATNRHLGERMQELEPLEDELSGNRAESRQHDAETVRTADGLQSIRDQTEVGPAPRRDFRNVTQELKAKLRNRAREVTGLIVTLVGTPVREVHDGMADTVFEALAAPGGSGLARLEGHFDTEAEPITPVRLENETAGVDDRYPRLMER